MSCSEQKEEAAGLINEAATSGARVKKACEALEVSFNSYLRWRSGKTADLRKGAKKTVPRKLQEDETRRFYDAANTAEYRDQTPGQIVASLLEKGIYYGSESTLYRILKAKNALQSRTESRKPVRRERPPELAATGPDQIWSWDITWLKTDVKGVYLFAYVILDVFSRKIVGWSIEETESTDLAQALFRRVIRSQGVCPRFVHADNGGPMKGLSLVAFLTQLQVGLSFSRPRVSDDNPFIESFFKTVKYRVGYPKVFTGIAQAREWFSRFIDWYNTHHRHSGIGYVTPQQKHTGEDILLFRLRQETLDRAAGVNPERFVRGPRQITPNRVVWLNRAS